MSAPVNPDDPGGLRVALNWFHTWFGLFVGILLFVIFWTGTLAVFDREIDRWMMPATRVAAAEVTVDDLLPIAQRLAPGGDSWMFTLPDERVPVVQLMLDTADGETVTHYLDPRTLAVLPEQGTLAGERFFYPYHFTLNISFMRLGLVICALAAVIMVSLCLSGVIIHRKIFIDFFTLRIVRKPQRTTLDLHNLTGVLALPFHLMIAFTGVAIFTFTYLPTAPMVAYRSDPNAEAGAWFSRKAAEAPGAPLTSLQGLRVQAARNWGEPDNLPKVVRLVHPGDANAYVEVHRPSNRTISYRAGSRQWFDAASGELLFSTPITKTTRAYQFMYGIHLIQFDHWLLRWLYFGSGLAGCVLIATGLLFWCQSRRKAHAKLGSRGAALSEAASIGATTGLLIASLAFLVANRLLPLGLEGRAATEVWAFHIVWIVAILHAFVRRGRAWAEQAWIIAVGSTAAVVLNAVTTPDNLVSAMTHGLWQVAGVDLFLLASAVVAILSAMKLQRRTTRAR